MIWYAWVLIWMYLISSAVVVMRIGEERKPLSRADALAAIVALAAR